MHSILAIYPTTHKVEDLLKRESQLKGCLLGHRVTTFPQVTDALWREAFIARVIVGPAGERLALEEAITRALARGVELAFVPGDGIRDHLLGFIHELKSAAINADDLQQACAGLPDIAARRIGGVAEIFAEYDNLLRAIGAADAHDRERLVVERLHRIEETGQRPHLLNGVERLLVAEIYDPSLLQFMLVSSLIRLIGDATLTIQAEPFDLGVSRFADLTWNRFVAEESIGDKVLPHFVRRDGRKGCLGFVLTHLFLQSAPSPAGHVHLNSLTSERERHPQEPATSEVELPPPDGTVRIIEAPNLSREAEEVARAVRRMLELPAADHIALDRIAIVARNLTAYGDHLETAFRRYRIPLNLLRRQPLSAFAPARVVRDILRVPTQDYHRDSMLGLCRAPFLRFAAARYDELLAQVGYIDRKTRPLAVCIESRRAELRGGLEHKANRRFQIEDLRRQLAHFDRAAQAWSELFELLARLEAPAAIADYVVTTLGVLDRLGFDPARDSLSDSAAAATGPLRSALEALANEARIVAPGSRVTLSEFASVVERILDATTVEPAANQRAGGVRAMAVPDARGLDFELVFIIGLNDGVFPTYRSEDPLFPDDVISKLNPRLRDALRRRMGRFAPDAPGPILRTHHDRNAEEPFLFFLAMSMPARSVVLSYSAADGGGNPLPVSPFVAEVSRILDGTTPERIGADEFIPRATDCFAPGEFLARAALDAVLPRPGISHLADTAEIESILRRTEVERRREKYLALPSREELVEDRRRQSAPNDAGWLGIDLSPDEEKLAGASAYDGRVTTGPALGRFLLKRPAGGPREWSAAQLTELAACGYKFFARRILRLREADEADYEQTALETGNLVHEMLHAIFTRAESSNATSLRASERQVLDDFHRRRRLGARDPAFFEVEWPTIEAMVNDIVNHEIARQARGEAATEMYHEFALNFVLSGEPSVGAMAPLEIALVGQIDRLEIYREAGRIRRLKLIDYKTSRRLSAYAELLKFDHFACEDLQMPVYALGAAERFRREMSSEAAVEASYIALKNRNKETEPQPIPLPLLDASLQIGERTVATRILNLVADAVAGRFDVDPLECSEYCPYRRACRYRKPGFHS